MPAKRMREKIKDEIVLALAGNPNVGKSTIFNSLTGMNQHTGNWPGKTVTNSLGGYTFHNKQYVIYDLPGIYSLSASSAEEEVAKTCIESGEAVVTVIVADATCLERNLNLVLQVLSITDSAVLCVNLMDEAKKKKIKVDLDNLGTLLKIPVVGTVARSGKQLLELMEIIEKQAEKSKESKEKVKDLKGKTGKDFIAIAKEIYSQCVSIETDSPNSFDRKIDRIVTSKTFGIPIMLLLLAGIFWITIVGANYPSNMLAEFFSIIEKKLCFFAGVVNMPVFLQGALISGVYKTLAWVVSVMLPPMAIFFPLFTLLEDFGYLPRIAFNLDTCFRKSCAHGKQSLTMCMVTTILNG